MNANQPDAERDGLIATSREAVSISLDLQEKGDLERAALWARFAAFLVASESYVDLERASAG